jgi:hypothetical protein
MSKVFSPKVARFSLHIFIKIIFNNTFVLNDLNGTACFSNKIIFSIDRCKTAFNLL